MVPRQRRELLSDTRSRTCWSLAEVISRNFCSSVSLSSFVILLVILFVTQRFLLLVSHQFHSTQFSYISDFFLFHCPFFSFILAPGRSAKHWTFLNHPIRPASHLSSLKYVPLNWPIFYVASSGFLLNFLASQPPRNTSRFLLVLDTVIPLVLATIIRFPSHLLFQKYLKL